MKLFYQERSRGMSLAVVRNPVAAAEIVAAEAAGDVEAALLESFSPAQVRLLMAREARLRAELTDEARGGGLIAAAFARIAGAPTNYHQCALHFLTSEEDAVDIDETGRICRSRAKTPRPIKRSPRLHHR